MAFAALGRQGSAYRVGQQVHLTLVESPVQQPQLDRCEIAFAPAANRPSDWCFFYGEAQRVGPDGRDIMRARAGCEPGECDKLLSSG